MFGRVGRQRIWRREPRNQGLTGNRGQALPPDHNPFAVVRGVVGEREKLRKLARSHQPAHQQERQRKYPMRQSHEKNLGHLARGQIHAGLVAGWIGRLLSRHLLTEITRRGSLLPALVVRREESATRSTFRPS